MIPLWVHILVVLALLGTNAWTFHTMKRKVEGLRAALLAKSVLLGGRATTGGSWDLARGETLTLGSLPPGRDIQIYARTTASIDVRYG
jgi:hypothetical protein